MSADSRDGSEVAYIDDPASASLVIAKADGTQLRVLAGARTSDRGAGPGAAYDHPALSLTGDRVAFIWSPALYDPTSRSTSSVYELRVVEVATGVVTTLARETGGAPFGPIKFSPEGDRILYSMSDANGVGTSLDSVGVDGSDPLVLVTGTGWGDWQTLPARP